MSAKLSCCLLFALVATPLHAYKVSEIIATMGDGDDGTDDDVAVVLVARDANNNVVSCTTPILNSYANDWSQGDTEEWDEDYIGDCAGFEFADYLFAGVAKTGADGLYVQELLVETTTDESFKCDSYDLRENPKKGEEAISQTNECKLYRFKREEK